MALGRINIVVTDESGNIVDSASLRYENEATGVLPQCYSDHAATSALGNPYVAADGRNAGCYLPGGEYKITATKGSLSIEWRYELVGFTKGIQRSVTASPIVTTSADEIINCNIASAATCQLPASASRSGAPLTFKDVGAQCFDNPITFSTTGGETIDGASTFVMDRDRQSVTFVPFNDGINTGWLIT